MAGSGFSFSTTPSSSSFLFSVSNPSATSATSSSCYTSLFGSSAFSASTTPTPSITHSLCGSSSLGSVLFGSSSYASTASSFGSSPLFGAASFGSATASSSTFGASTLFGSSPVWSGTAQTSTFGSSVSSSGSSPFGSSTTQSGSGLFGASSTGSPAFSSTPLGASSSPFGSSSSSSPASAATTLVGSTSASSPLSLPFPTASSSASSAPSFAFPATSTASSTSSASRFSSPPTSAAGFSFPASSTALAPGFSLSSGAADVSSPFQASSTPGFSFSKGTGSLAESVGVSSSITPSLTASSGLSSGFSFATSGSQSPASVSAPALSMPASKSSFGTVSSSLFSTVTPTTSASTPAATTISSASSIGFTGSALTFPVISPAASSAATTGLTSGSAAAPSGGIIGFASISTSTTLGTSSVSLSLSTKSPATGTASQPQTTSAAASLGYPSFTGSCSGCSAITLRVDLGNEMEQIHSDSERVGERIMEQPVVQETELERITEQPVVRETDLECTLKEFPGVGEDHGGIREVMADIVDGELACQSFAIAPSTTDLAKGVEANSAVAPASNILINGACPESPLIIMNASSTQSATVDVGKKQPGDCVEESQEEASESSSIGSEVVAGDEAGVSDAKGCASSVVSLCTDTNDLTLSPQDAQSCIKAILGKYGDITKGSIVKSMVVRSTLLHLVAEVVHRLSNHTIKTLDSEELQLLQKWTDDAVAVGFSVEWLQQRLGKISAASKYHDRLVHLDKLGQQIDAVKKSLMEMELQRMVWEKEVDHMKIQLEGGDLEASNLGEGLI